MPDQLVDVDGVLCVRHVYEGTWNTPERVTFYWPVGHDGTVERTPVWNATWKANWAIFTKAEVTLPIPVEPTCSDNDGRYVGRAPWGPWPINVRLVNGGRTQAIKREIEPIPCPRVRAGIETRYRSGRWEKYLKREGWVRA